MRREFLWTIIVRASPLKFSLESWRQIFSKFFASKEWLVSWFWLKGRNDRWKTSNLATLPRSHWGNMSLLDARLTTSVSIDAPRDYPASYRESRQRGKWDWRGGGRWIDLEEIRTRVIFVRIKGSLLSFTGRARVCVCVHTFSSRTYVFLTYTWHFPDIRGETCYCVMISERFVASRCNPAGISTTIDV